MCGRYCPMCCEDAPVKGADPALRARRYACVESAILLYWFWCVPQPKCKQNPVWTQRREGWLGWRVGLGSMVHIRNGRDGELSMRSMCSPFHRVKPGMTFLAYIQKWPHDCSCQWNVSNCDAKLQTGAFEKWVWLLHVLLSWLEAEDSRQNPQTAEPAFLKSSQGGKLTVKWEISQGKEH